MTTAFDDLLSQAFLGTGRGVAPPPPLPAAVAEVVPAADSPEAKLLATAAALSLWSRAGVVPAEAAATPEPANADVLPECSAKAGQLLDDLLREGPREVLLEWLAVAGRARRRPPHRLLPKLLDAAAAQHPLRPLVAPLLDERRAWLVRQNPRWQFTVVAGDDPKQVWQTGNRDQRVSALKQLRATDPAAARELVQATWAADPADERQRFLDAFAVGLSMDDEPLLEAALDDRAKTVRATAAERLSQLPQSQLVRRTADRLAPLFKVVPEAKEQRRFTLDVELPAELTAAMARDGVEREPPSKTVGQRQWWLQQMLSAVPPSTWSALWTATPAECVAAAPGEYRAAMVDGWTAATRLHRDAAWADALLRAKTTAKKADDPPAPDADLLALLPADVAERFALDYLTAARSAQGASHLLHNGEGIPLTNAVGRRMLKLLSIELAVPTYLRPTYGVTLLGGLANRLPPSLLTEAQAAVAADATGFSQTQVEAFLTRLKLRHDLHKEFET